VAGYAPDAGGDDLYPVLVAGLNGRPLLSLELAGEEDLDAHPLGPQHPVDVEPVRRDLLADGPGAVPGSSSRGFWMRSGESMGRASFSTRAWPRAKTRTAGDRATGVRARSNPSRGASGAPSVCLVAHSGDTALPSVLAARKGALPPSPNDPYPNFTYRSPTMALMTARARRKREIVGDQSRLWDVNYECMGEVPCSRSAPQAPL
jgi:hypothetical protein